MKGEKQNGDLVLIVAITSCVLLVIAGTLLLVVI